LEPHSYGVCRLRGAVLLKNYSLTA
jgi:hypothetical protein